MCSMEDYEKGFSTAQLPMVEFKPSPYMPVYKERMQYISFLQPYIIPNEFTGWRDEQLSWKKNAYISAGLSPSPTYRFSGPDSKKFLSKYCANTFEKFPVGSVKHCICCNEDGTIAGDGVILRTAEDVYETYWVNCLAVYVQADAGKYDMQFEDLSDQKCLLQVAGPKSLQILEEVSGEDLHDVKFMRFKYIKINGKDFRIARLGMAGTLAYELHGAKEDSAETYDAIYQLGKKYGMRRLGFKTYNMNHTENGFPQFGHHFMSNIAAYPEFDMDFGVIGSMGTDYKPYVNPYELDWGFGVKFDHDFVGREALEKIAETNIKTVVSLIWNKEDICDVYASQFEEGESYRDMFDTNDINNFINEKYYIYQDRVEDKDGNFAGVSSGRSYSIYYKKMHSLCIIDKKYAESGTEVAIIWGNPGSRQKKIRARVHSFPLYNESRNQKFDVNTIPRLGEK